MSTNYQNLLAYGNGDYGAGDDPWTLEFSGLTPGHLYEVQIWANNSRIYGYSRYNRLSASLFGSPSVSIAFNDSGADGDVGQFAVGIIMADESGTISLTAQGGGENYALYGVGCSTQVNAFQLRDLSVNSTLSIAQSGTNVVISWTGSGGTLQQAPALTGPWTTNSAASPYAVPPTASQQFYRVKLP